MLLGGEIRCSGMLEAVGDSHAELSPLARHITLQEPSPVRRSNAFVGLR